MMDCVSNAELFFSSILGISSTYLFCVGFHRCWDRNIHPSTLDFVFAQVGFLGAIIGWGFFFMVDSVCA